jgi:TRAP-type uncharacterized transport system substrate-binding protein
VEPLPRGAQFIRAKTLWEIALDVAGDFSIPYTGDRDICISIGSGSGESFRSALRMSVGSPILAHAVVRGDLEMAFVNPSALLTQAYRGVGLFAEPLPVRVVANYPSWDRYVQVIHPRAGITSLAQVKDQRYPLRLSTREDPTHSTRVLINQLFEIYGFTLDEMLSWGGSLQLNGPPGDPRRLTAIEKGEVDAVFDEGIPTWLDHSLAHGYQPMRFEEPVFQRLQALGWRRVQVPAGRYPHVTADIDGVDYGGWPLYTRESLSDEAAYKVCAALKNRMDEIPWEQGTFTDIAHLWQDTPATPLDVPLHPGAIQWCREQGIAFANPR